MLHWMGEAHSLVIVNNKSKLQQDLLMKIEEVDSLPRGVETTLGESSNYCKYMKESAFLQQFCRNCLVSLLSYNSHALDFAKFLEWTFSSRHALKCVFNFFFYYYYTIVVYPDIPDIDLGLFHHCHFLFFWLCIVSENKYSLICSTFTGTLNQLHFILFIHLSSHFIFQFLHVVLMEYACLLYLKDTARSEIKTWTFNHVWNFTDWERKI